MPRYAPRTSTAAVAKAKSKVGTSYPPGWCQKWVCADVFGTGGVGDFDGDRAADAEDGWKAAVAKGRVVHAKDIASTHDIPAGVALYWTGGRNDHGHAAVSAGAGYIYSTDLPVNGRIGRVELAEVRRRWGYTFVGYVLVTGNGYTLTDEPGVTPAPTPRPGARTVFDVSFWNVASPRWFTAWAPRAKGIAAEVTGTDMGTEASVHGFAEVYNETQAATLATALPGFERVSGRAGLELFFDASKWRLERAVHKGGYFSRIQGRYALVVHLERISTGRHVAFVVTHAPANSDTLRAAFGRWHARLVSQIDGPAVALGDYNKNPNGESPRKEIEALGYRSMRIQAPISHGSADEFPSRGWSLSDIYTKPSEARITGGQIDLTASTLSDHRRIEARVVLP